MGFEGQIRDVRMRVCVRVRGKLTPDVTAGSRGARLSSQFAAGGVSHVVSRDPTTGEPASIGAEHCHLACGMTRGLCGSCLEWCVGISSTLRPVHMLRALSGSSVRALRLAHDVQCVQNMQ